MRIRHVFAWLSLLRRAAVGLVVVSGAMVLGLTGASDVVIGPVGGTAGVVVMPVRGAPGVVMAAVRDTAGLAAPGLALAAPACRAPAGFDPLGRIESRDVVIVYRARPAIEVGRHFAVEAIVCAEAPAEVTAVRVDADMPEHRHGMNYRASVSAKGDGLYVAEGLLFHMPGRWRLLFDVERAGRTERLEAEIPLE